MINNIELTGDEARVLKELARRAEGDAHKPVEQRGWLTARFLTNAKPINWQRLVDAGLLEKSVGQEIELDRYRLTNLGADALAAIEQARLTRGDFKVGDAVEYRDFVIDHFEWIPVEIKKVAAVRVQIWHPREKRLQYVDRKNLRAAGSNWQTRAEVAEDILRDIRAAMGMPAKGGDVLLEVQALAAVKNVMDTPEVTKQQEQRFEQLRAERDELKQQLVAARNASADAHAAAEYQHRFTRQHAEIEALRDLLKRAYTVIADAEYSEDGTAVCAEIEQLLPEVVQP